MIYDDLLEPILSGTVVKATKFVSPIFIVRAVRKLYGKKIDKREKSITIILTIGTPNYAEREFIKVCKKAKEEFPIKKVQLKLYNPKPKKLAPKKKKK